ncbi:MAG TPA: dihydrolipoyl dehydrogenase [Thermomicrobiales bacterium]|nr:dihydrolipoyl dehydrogenase [Thermomicrobiales bacterium]
MAQEQVYDVAFLGGGTGGYVAAIRASQLGLKAVVIEKDLVGGTCVHRGCIPAKALLKAASVATLVKDAKDFGVTPGEISLDYSTAMSRARKVVDQNYKGIQFLFKKHKIDVVEGWGTITGPGAISVEKDGNTTEVRARNIVIDTGSTPRPIDGLEIDGKRVFTSDEATTEPFLPKRVIVRGGGATGLEFASVYREFDCEVTLVGRVAPNEDADVQKDLARAFQRQGIRVLANVRPSASDFTVTDDGVSMKVSVDGKDETIEADALLVAIGRYGNTEGFGLENIGVNVVDGYITVDDFMRTNVENVYAIGDVTGLQQLAHTAMHQGVVAVETMAGHKPEVLDYNKIPWVTYCHPEIGSVGLTEAKARDAGLNIKTGKFPLSANGKARVENETVGFAKMVVDADTDQILGIHLLGGHATELISVGGLAMLFEATAWELGITTFPHPTISEVLHEAALDVDGAALHF